MCPLPETKSLPAPSKKVPDPLTKYKYVIGDLSWSTFVLLVATLVLATNKGNSSNKASADAPATVSGVKFLDSKASSRFFASEDDNVCAGAKLAFKNKLCADL
jgi:hypothetical protein